MKVGDVQKYDFQSDMFGGEYRLVEKLPRGIWKCEILAPSDEVIEAIRAFYMDSANPSLGYHDPFGPERRRATRQESMDQEIALRVEQAGDIREMRFVSRSEWSKHF